MDAPNRTTKLINSNTIIVSNMKEDTVFWVPIYDDWAQGWTPIIMEKRKNGKQTHKSFERP